jgi:hypothetical protein
LRPIFCKRQLAARWIFVHKNHLAALEVGTALGTRAVWKSLKCMPMARKKSTDQDALLTCPIRTRVTKTAWNKLEKIQKESGCQSVGEVARMILSDEAIKCFYVDVSLNAPMEQMALIRKELKAIGININQQTKYFNMSKSDAQRGFYALKTTDLYQQVGDKVEGLLMIVNQLAEKWLRGS